MMNTRTEGEMESLADAARRLLAELDARKHTVSERRYGSDEIGSELVSPSQLGNSGSGGSRRAFRSATVLILAANDDKPLRRTRSGIVW